MLTLQMPARKLTNVQKMKLIEETLEKEIEQLRFQHDSLQIAIVKLKTDSSYMAKVAREKYNMGLPDEEIIKIINKNSKVPNEK